MLPCLFVVFLVLGRNPGMTNSETFPAFVGVLGSPVSIKRTTPLSKLRLLVETKTPSLATVQSLLVLGIVWAPTTFRLAL